MEYTILSLHPPNNDTLVRQRSVAEVAQLVERNLAKVEVASSSLVFRSKVCDARRRLFLFTAIVAFKLTLLPPARVVEW